MSDLFKDIADKARETLNPIVDKAKNMVESGELKEMASDALESAKGLAEGLKDSVASGDLKEKATAAVETAKEKAAPVIDKVVAAASDAIDKVKDGVSQLASGEKAPLNVKNELFSELSEQIASEKEAAQKQAEAMEEKIEQMLDGEKKD